MKSHALLSGLAACALLLAGCQRTEVQTHSISVGTNLARPDVVVIDDFSVVASDVKLDRGLLQRAGRLVNSSDASAQQQAIARKVSEATSEALVKEVRKLGLPAVRNAVPAGGTKLIVTGQFVSVDEGNQTRRNIIGLGAGSSKVEADAQVSYQAAGAAPRHIESLTATAQSSRKPGVLESGGVGAATAVASTAGAMPPALSAEVDALAAKMAEEIAKKLHVLFKQQGWVAR